MWDTIKKLEYRARAGIADAKAELNNRLSDRMELPLPGLHGENLYLTGVSLLRKKAEELDILYQQLPRNRGVQDTILLDAWSSATIEGARTTVEKVRESMTNPKTKDDLMVINTMNASHYAYRHPITEQNIRTLWNTVVCDVCENETCKGSLYRDGMVYIGSSNRVIHVPAKPEQLPDLMEHWFAFRNNNTDNLLIRSFVCHFYFVYLHPFCDGNGRTARILNASHLFHGGYQNMKNLPLSSSINNQLSGYYSSLTDSEAPLNGTQPAWLDLSPFVSYMLDAFERCLIDAALSVNKLTDSESKLLEKMNKTGSHAEITVTKAMGIVELSESATRRLLNCLAQKGYLTVDTTSLPYIYKLEQHLP